MYVFSFTDPDTKPRQLAPCNYWFEDIRPEPGMIFEGCASVEIDEEGEWFIKSLRLGTWRLRNGQFSFTEKGLLCQHHNAGHGVPSHYFFHLIEKHLRETYADDITEECIKAGEA